MNCLDYSGQNELKMWKCHGQKGNQEWEFHGDVGNKSSQIMHILYRSCK